MFWWRKPSFFACVLSFERIIIFVGYDSRKEISVLRPGKSIMCGQKKQHSANFTFVRVHNSGNHQFLAHVRPKISHYCTLYAFRRTHHSAPFVSFSLFFFISKLNSVLCSNFSHPRRERGQTVSTTFLFSQSDLTKQKTMQMQNVHTSTPQNDPVRSRRYLFKLSKKKHIL